MLELRPAIMADHLHPPVEGAEAVRVERQMTSGTVVTRHLIS